MEAASVIQGAWRRFVHRKFIGIAQILKNEDFTQKGHDVLHFRAYMFSESTLLKIKTFTKLLGVISTWMGLEGCKSLTEFTDLISSAYIHVLFKKQSLTSLEFEETELDLERELFEAAEVFMFEFESFLFHVVVKARQNKSGFFFEHEEHLMDSSHAMVLRLIASFEAFMDKNEKWKKQIQEMRLFAIENSIYTLQKLKSLKQNSSFNMNMVLVKEDFYKKKYLEIIANFSSKAVIWKDMNEQVLKLRKCMELSPLPHLPVHVLDRYPDLRNERYLTTEVMLHGCLMDRRYEIPFISTLEDIVYTHEFDDLHAELSFGHVRHRQNKAFSLVFLGRFLHSVSSDVEVFKQRLPDHHFIFDPTSVFHLIRNFLVNKVDFASFRDDLKITWTNLHEGLMKIAREYTTRGLESQLPAVFGRVWKDLVQKLDEPNDDIHVNLAVVVDCFAFIFDELNMIKTLQLNYKIKRNIPSIPIFGYVEEFSNFKKRFTSTPQLKVWIRKTLNYALVNEEVRSCFLSNLIFHETEETTMKLFIKWMLLHIIFSLPVSQMFSATKQLNLHDPENLCPSKLVHTLQYAKEIYPETLQLDAEHVSILRIAMHNAAVYLTFFHTILKFAQENPIEADCLGSFIMRTEALTVQAFTTFINKTTFETLEKMELIQCFAMSLDQKSTIYLRMRGSIARFCVNAVTFEKFAMPELDYMHPIVSACIEQVLNPRLLIIDQISKVQRNVHKKIYLKYILKTLNVT